MKNGQLLRVKVINTEADLPEEEGFYFVNLKTDKPELVGFNTLRFLIHRDKEVWLDSVDWYLLPIKQGTELPPIHDNEQWLKGELIKFVKMIKKHYGGQFVGSLNTNHIIEVFMD